MRDRRLMLSEAGLLLPVPPSPRPPALSAASPAFLTFVSMILGAVGAVAIVNMWTHPPDLMTASAAPVSHDESKKLDDLKGEFDRRVPLLEDHDRSQQEEINVLKTQYAVSVKTLDQVVMIGNVLYVLVGLVGSLVAGVAGQVIYTWWQERRKVKNEPAVQST